MSTNISIQFVVDKYRPDNRQFKQQSLELVPLKEKLLVQVDVPVTGNFANAEALLAEPLSGGNPEPILNIVGLKAIIDQFEEIFSDEEKDKDVPWDESSDGDWGTEKSDDWNESSDEEETWEEEETTSEENWNEDEEAWD